MGSLLKGLANFIGVVIVIAAIVAAFVILQPQVQASTAQSGQGAAARNATTITNRVTIDKGNVVLTVSATGSIVATQASSLTFDTTGIVRQILVKEGQKVDAGQTLASVDDSSQQSAVKQAELNLQAAQSALNKVLQPVDANTIAVAEADVKAAEGSYQSKASSVTAADLAAGQAKIQQAQSDFDYATKLMKGAGGQYGTDDPNYKLAQAQAGQASFNLANAQLSLQSAQQGSSLKSAQANIALSQAKLAQTKAGPTQSDIDLAQQNVVTAQFQLDQAKQTLAKTVLTAPYAGVVNQITAKVGQPASGTAMILTDLNTLYANINVDESDITQIAPGQKIDLTVDALPGVDIKGKVDRIYPIADSTAAVITYPVHITLDKMTQTIRAGMTANATINVKEVDNVLRVPNNYLKSNRTTGQTTVNVVNPDGTGVTAVPIKLGLAGADYTEIIEGLNPGDTVALVAASTQQGSQGSQGSQQQQAPAQG
ncbi:MAG: efflux RND transporter periplasmic adaptor subunit [Chloroflexota bacterium]